MYGDLLVRDQIKRDEEKAKALKRAKNPDLEDGEIASDREERRAAARDPFRDERREDRREERRGEDPKRRNYYDDGDRLNFYRHRRPDNNNNRGVPLRHSSWQNRSPPARHSPYQ